MSNAAAWWRVAQGLQRVASLSVSRATPCATQLVQHGMGVGRSVEQALWFMQHNNSHATTSTNAATDWKDDSTRDYDRTMQSDRQAPPSSENVTPVMMDAVQTESPTVSSTATSPPPLLQEETSPDTSVSMSQLKQAMREPTPAALNMDDTNGKVDFEPMEPREMIEEVPPPARFKQGRPVPSTRAGRAWGFASLGFGLALGTARQGLKRLAGGDSSSSLVVHDANADLLAATLCRMRGAALKMGQMLSIQDEVLLPPALARALQQVRQGADAMPTRQLHSQLQAQLGKDWQSRFVEFEEEPFAAASIGQVHRATVRDSNEETKQVVVKVQYPGVANSIDSDIRNLNMLVNWTGVAPKGLFLENVMRVGRDELAVECDYRNERKQQERMRALVQADPVLQENRFVVPAVVPDLCTEQVLVSEYCSGSTIDKVSQLDQSERNRIARTIMYLTIKELFDWRLMQTDPNWGNFLYDFGSRTTSLIDFGATREYSKDFVDGYLRIVWASANRDEDTLMEQSHRMQFLTGQENEEMLEAHKMSGFTVGEPFHSDEPFDFVGSRISERMGAHTSVFLKHRLTAPPEEVYTLHRKLAGTYMLCIKLEAVIPCRDLLRQVVADYDFQDGIAPPQL